MQSTEPQHEQRKPADQQRFGQQFSGTKVAAEKLSSKKLVTLVSKLHFHYFHIESRLEDTSE